MNPPNEFEKLSDQEVEELDALVTVREADECNLILTLMDPQERAAQRDLEQFTAEERKELKINLLCRHLELAGVHVELLKLTRPA